MISNTAFLLLGTEVLGIFLIKNNKNQGFLLLGFGAFLLGLVFLGRGVLGFFKVK